MQTKTKGIYGKTQEFRPVFRCWAFMDGDARIFTRMVNNHCTMRTLRPLVRFCFALWPILHCGTACFAVPNGHCRQEPGPQAVGKVGWGSAARAKYHYKGGAWHLGRCPNVSGLPTVEHAAGEAMRATLAENAARCRADSFPLLHPRILPR